MAVTIKSEREIELMRKSGRILAQVHMELGKAIKPGISTWDINVLGEELIRSYGCIPNFLISLFSISMVILLLSVFP